MQEDERCLIISNLKIVDRVYLSIDEDKTVIKTGTFTKKYLNLQFDVWKWRRSKNSTIPEINICKKLEIKMVDNLGDKVQSSWLLKK